MFNTHFNSNPSDLHVLLVDDDPTCLTILTKMLQVCGYKVTKCSRARDALSIIREGRCSFDFVISDVHMPDMNGIQLLEKIRLEMDLPVVLLSADERQKTVDAGIDNGACDYLVKPVDMDILRIIWKHVALWKRNHLRGRKRSNDEHDDGKLKDDKQDSSNPGQVKGEEESAGKTEPERVSLNRKRTRMVWTPELHQQFVAAVNQIGPEKAVPKKILEVMNVAGLTRENVASHLQKYRMYNKKPGGKEQYCRYGRRAPTQSQYINQELSSRLEACNTSDQFTSVPPQVQQPHVEPLRQETSANCMPPSNQRIGMENFKIEMGNVQASNSGLGGDVHYQVPSVTLDPSQFLPFEPSVYLSDDSNLERSFKNPKMRENSWDHGFFNNEIMPYHPSSSEHNFVVQNLSAYLPSAQSLEYQLNTHSLEHAPSSSFGSPLFPEHFDQQQSQKFVGGVEPQVNFDQYDLGKGSASKKV